MSRNGEETAFERELRENLQNPAFRESFERELHAIRVVDRIVNRIDEERVRRGMSKAELARAMGSNPAAVRRLLTADGVNPQLETVAALADAVGLSVELRPKAEANGDLIPS